MSKLYHILAGILICTVVQAATLEVGEGMQYSSVTGALQAATDGDTLLVYPGIYREGTIDIKKRVVVKGIGNPVLDGENEHEVLTIWADSVVISGLTVSNVGVSYVKDRAAIHIVKGRGCTIESNKLKDAFFGIYLEHCRDCTVRDNHIVGSPAHEMNTGNAIHLWYCNNIVVDGNHAEGHRDGIYLEFVDNSSVENNTVINNLRYGLHFMFSDNDRYLNNRFISNGAGVAVMFSRDIWMENNDFANNWGSASYGLLLKDITDSEIRFNRFNRNTIGIYSEGVIRTRITNNDFNRNGWALKILGSCTDMTIEKNNFLNNSFDVSTNTSRNYNNYDGNFWSENAGGYDLDRDGISDVPYRPVKLFSYMISHMQSSTILMRSLLIDLVNWAEKVAPVITPHNLVDNTPLMRRIEHDWNTGIE